MTNALLLRERLAVIQRLANVLADENAALKRLDFTAAVTFVRAKETALADLMARSDLPAPSSTILEHLLALVAENQVLLEKSIATQTRITRIIGRCNKPPAAEVCYNGLTRLRGSKHSDATNLVANV